MNALGTVAAFVTGLSPWRILAWVVGALAVISASFIGGCQFGEGRVQAEWNNQKLAAANKTIEVQAKQSTVTATVDQQSQVAQEKVRTVFRDRVVYRDREVPHEVIVRQDAGCTIPNRFVSLWNSANRAQLPDPASSVDEAPSGVVLSDVETQKDREAELCISNTEQLKSLQAWIKGQQAATK